MAVKMDTAKFDDVLMGILQHCEQVQPFLDSIFSFLARRTDFFQVMRHRDDKMGFPPGVAEKIVLKIFKNYQQIVARTSNQAQEKVSEKRNPKARDDLPSVCPSTNQTTSSENAGTSVVMSTASSDAIPAVTHSLEVETSPCSDQIETQQPATEATCSASADSTSTAISTSSSQAKEDVESSEAKGLIPGKSADCYNGAVLDKYSWSQTISEIEVKIPVPSSVTKGRDVGVEIKSSHLKVWLKKGISAESDSNVLIDGKLQRTIKCEDSMWLLEGGKYIVVNLDKTEERFWTAVLEGDAEIDKTKVDTTRDISDFDEQTQSDFHHVMYDHRQKLQGKPTSQEVKTHDLLKQAWNAKGSPFAGTDFDPSKVNISPSYG
ncbi:protein localization to pericentriolar material [Desmophyllum pertusum]|uniref:Protein localization to pericentriolar material n=1 Tax=Desmophyllum pertusum TaxID=174260 RepID=A0A9W9ZHR5_9CNID|nr:protein localization to pericentriolar material [Desmophyllum pertusum]